MLRQVDQNCKYQHQIEGLIEIEYQKYRESKRGPLIGSGSKKQEVKPKQNSYVNGSPESISFGKIKQMNRSEQNFHKLLDMLGCKNYQQALLKVDRVKKAEKFLQKVRQMTEAVAPGEEPSLNFSWKIIKQAISCFSLRQREDKI